MEMQCKADRHGHYRECTSNAMHLRSMKVHKSGKLPCIRRADKDADDIIDIDEREAFQKCFEARS